MDFARPHIYKSNPTTRSNIKLVPIPDYNPTNNNDDTTDKTTTTTTDVNNNNDTTTTTNTTNENNNNVNNNNDDDDDTTTQQLTINPQTNHLDHLLLTTCNLATTTLFQTQKSPPLSTSTLYPTRLLAPSPLITPHSLVVILESFDNLTFAYATPGDVFHNRNGAFHHDDFLNKPFGSQIRSRNNEGVGFVYVLRPTVELWARSLNHRTQIVHELDASFVCGMLELEPGDVVLESGTGSGAMSHALLRCIAPSGRLHTFEFNKMRVETAREEFKKNQVDHLVTVHYRDVCGKDSPQSGGFFDLDDTQRQRDNSRPPIVADAIFLDLPEPWLAIPHAAHAIKPNGKLCSYSPCMEQTQKTVVAMTSCGFHSFRTVEVRLKECYVDEVRLEPPPKRRLVLGEERNGGEEEEEGGMVETMICARPFQMMRGHTAFLTFATAGLIEQPDPRKTTATTTTTSATEKEEMREEDAKEEDTNNSKSS